MGDPFRCTVCEPPTWHEDYELFEQHLQRAHPKPKMVTILESRYWQLVEEASNAIFSELDLRGKLLHALEEMQNGNTLKAQRILSK